MSIISQFQLHGRRKLPFLQVVLRCVLGTLLIAILLTPLLSFSVFILANLLPVPGLRYWFGYPWVPAFAVSIAFASVLAATGLSKSLGETLNLYPRIVRVQVQCNEQGQLTEKLVNLKELRKFIARRFDENEFLTLCFDLGVDYGDLLGEGKSGKVRELVKGFNRSNQLDELVNQLCKDKERRPLLLSDNIFVGEASIRGNRKPSVEAISAALCPICVYILLFIAAMVLLFGLNRFPRCISSKDILVSLDVLRNGSQIDTLAPGEIVDVDPGIQVRFRARMTPVTDGMKLPVLKCAWEDAGFISDGALLREEGCTVDYRSGSDEYIDPISLQLTQANCSTLDTYPYFINNRP